MQPDRAAPCRLGPIGRLAGGGRWVAIAAAVAVALTLGRPARACHRLHESPFELFDRAATVAQVRVAARSQDVFALKVLTSLRGATATTELTVRESATSCRAGYRDGSTAVAFLAADGSPLGFDDGYIETSQAPDLVEVLARYARGNEDERAATLVEAIATGSPFSRREAAWALATRPDLVARIAPCDQKRLALEVSRSTSAGSALPLVLARIFTPDAVDAVTRSRADRAADPMTTQALRLIDAMRVVSPYDRERLAATIETSAQDAARSAAMERCERLWDRTLGTFWVYVRGSLPQATWSALAAACRSGVAAPK